VAKLGVLNVAQFSNKCIPRIGESVLGTSRAGLHQTASKIPPQTSNNNTITIATTATPTLSINDLLNHSQMSDNLSIKPFNHSSTQCISISTAAQSHTIIKKGKQQQHQSNQA